MYVDDLIVISTSVEDIKEFKHKMKKEFKMTNLRLLTYYLIKKFKMTNSVIKHFKILLIKSHMKSSTWTTVKFKKLKLKLITWFI